jgi:CDP-diacylglycerol--glycerol-3-phosphate 3-phosphatidyltransferase
MALNGRWAIAFALFVIALITDFLDGLAAKKLGAYSKFGEELDPLADSALVVAGMVGLSLTGHLSWWFTAGVLLFGLSVGNKRLVRPKTKRGAAVQKVASVACLFIAWTGIAWFFATLAFGWRWWYVELTILILAGSASLKRHRLRAWLAGG